MINRTFPALLLLFFLCMPLMLWSQENIPLGSWRSHFSYRSANSVAVTPQRVYAASTNGLFYLDREDNSITVLTAQQGLSDVGISSLSFQEAKKVLLIAYRNGNIDLLQDGRLTNINSILDASIPGQRKIHQVVFSNNFAFIATDYGISVLDLDSKEFQESYFNLGEAGQAAEVFQLAVWNDSLFAATNHGLIANAIQGANLSDFRSWRRYEEAEFPVAGNIRTLAATAQGLFAGVDGQRLLKRQGGEWQETNFETEKSFRVLKAVNDKLLISLEGALYLMDTGTGNVNEVSSPLIDSPGEATLDNNGNFWIADSRNGLISDFEGAFKAYIPNGPLADVAETLYAENDKIVAVFNQGRETPQQQEAPGGFSVFTEGSWVNYTADDVPGMPRIDGFSDVVYTPHNKRYYFSSLSGGLMEWDPENGVFRQYTAAEEGVSLQMDATGRTPVSTLSADPQGRIWMVQPATEVPLHRFDPSTGEWQGYLAGNANAGSAGEILVLSNNDKWLQLSGKAGMLVFNEELGQSRYLTGQNSGGVLIDQQVRSMALDLEGQLWIGLGQGINYLPNPYVTLQQPNVSVVFPIYERNFLLKSESVTSLEVDGGNRKWIGTSNGLWVAGDYGDTIYYNFTKANAPLPDNHITSQAILQQSGEVFIGTPGGIASYRSGATAAGFQHAAAIKVYPNPVYPGYSGKVGLTGLASDVIVKITDISGKLVKEIASEGGTASWDLTDTQGRRPATGVYLIFSTTRDGVETLAGKMAVIN